MTRACLVAIMFFLLNCKDAQTQSAIEQKPAPASPISTPSPRLFVIGDNLIHDTIASLQGSVPSELEIIDDTHADIGCQIFSDVLLGGVDDPAQYDHHDFGPNDSVIFMEGIYNTLIFDQGSAGYDDLIAKAENSISIILNSGSTVYLATVPHLPNQGYTVCSNQHGGSDAESDYISQALRDFVAAENNPKLILVDINILLGTGNYEADGLTISQAGQAALTEIFLNATGN